MKGVRYRHLAKLFGSAQETNTVAEIYRLQGQLLGRFLDQGLESHKRHARGTEVVEGGTAKDEQLAQDGVGHTFYQRLILALLAVTSLAFPVALYLRSSITYIG